MDEALLARITRLSAEPGVAETAELVTLANAVSVRPEERTANPPAPNIPPAAVTGEKACEPPDPSAIPAPVTSRRQETMAVKVDTAKLDYLVDMAGEMVIAQSLVRHDPDLAGSRTRACSATSRN